jgi:proline racemase
MRIRGFTHLALAAVLLCLLASGCSRTVTATIIETGTVTSTVTSTATVTVPQLALEITSPQNGDAFNVNVQKVSGTVSDPTAEVKVNGADAFVAQDGSFYGLVDLPRGESVIEVIAIRGDDSISQEVTVTFNPPLAVYLDLPETSADVDYRITPLPLPAPSTIPRLR